MMTSTEVVRRIGFYTLICVVSAFFVVPMLWLVTVPFDSKPSLSVSVPDLTLGNFETLADNPQAYESLFNSVIISAGSMVLVVGLAALGAYALSRVRIRGRDALLYSLLLLSSIVTGTAAIVPLYVLLDELQLLDTHTGVVLAMSGGLLPAALFILKDFMDATPRSYEESARVFGASPLRILKDVVIPIARPGLATIAVWTVVQVWGNFLIPYLIYKDPDKNPAAVRMFTFYTESGQPNLLLVSAFSLAYSVPVIAMYLFVSARYGFRFHGGIKR
jgi:multiple sugar transport system permease protein